MKLFYQVTANLSNFLVMNYECSSCKLLIAIQSKLTFPSVIAVKAFLKLILIWNIQITALFFNLI